MIINIVFIFLSLKLIEIKGGLTANRYSVEDSLESDEFRTFLDRQIPNDMVYDLVGNAILITIDDQTGKYLTFKVKKDNIGLPYVEDPETGLRYLVVSSRTSKEIGLYRLTLWTKKGGQRSWTGRQRPSTECDSVTEDWCG